MKTTIPKAKFERLKKKLKKLDPGGALLMQSVDLAAVRAITKARGEVRRDVVTQ